MAFAALLGTALASGFILVFGRSAMREIGLGLTVAVLDGVAHAWMNSKAVGASARAFLRWGIVMNGLRFGLVLLILLLVSFMTRLQVEPFAVTAAGCAIVFLTANAVAISDVGRTGIKT